MSGIGINPYSAVKTTQIKDSLSPVSKPGVESNPLVEGLSDFKSALEGAEKAALQTAATGADPHAMVEAFANAEMVLDTAVTIRDKVVEAYQELLRMPV